SAQGSCSGSAAATVSISVDQSAMWYEDTDGDGHGDPASSMVACGQPTGYVANANDDCPGVFGRIGNSCDDGNPNTVLDVIGSDCACVGQACTTDLFFVFETGINGHETTWEILRSGDGTVVRNGGGWYPSNANGSEATCLPDGCYTLRVLDSGGDGMAG